MSINATTLSIAGAILVLGICLGLMIAWRITRRKRIRDHSSHLAAGKEWLKEDPIAAACILAEAVTIWPDPHARILQGEALESVKEYRAAASAYDDAHHIAIGWRGTRRWAYDRGLAIRTNILAANAHMLAKNWDLAVSRANGALAQLKDVPGLHVETESSLRVIRMIATLQLERGSQAWDNAKPDAQWILNHATTEEHRRLAEGLLNADGVWRTMATYLGQNDLKDDSSSKTAT